MSTSAKAITSVSLQFCHSVVCVQPHAKGYAWIYMKPFLKVDPTQSQNNFILEVIQTDIYCHLEVTVVQQGHFGIKSTVAQKR